MSPADRLVGRDAVLAAAGAALADTLAGSGQLVLISGEAGIGKTEVLAALVDRAGPDALVLRGFCWDDAGVPPYWPWAQVLRATGLSTGDLGEAAWLLDGSRSAESMDAAAAADAQFRLFEAVARCLSGLAVQRPVLVVLDDLQWADEPSLRMLEFLARTLVSDRVLLLGAYRDTEATPALVKLTASARQLPLAGLGHADVEAMVHNLWERVPSPQVVTQIWTRSGGNPFFVRELTQLLIAQGAWQGHLPIPAGVAETLRRRLARLSTPCVRLLEHAAVAGRDIDVSLLVDSGAATDPAELLGLLDEARHAGVVAGAVDLRFAHDLYRETVLAGLAAPTKAAINLSLGRALQRRPAAAARVATHLLAAGQAAERDSLAYLILAAREATTRLGHDDACAHYLRALDVLNGLADNQRTNREQLEIVLELAAAHERSGMANLALQRFREAAELSRASDDAVGLANAALGMHALGNRSGAANTELLDLLREATARIASNGDQPALQALLLAATARTMRHGTARLPGDDILATAQEAVRLATIAGDAHAIATAKLAVHDSIWSPGTAAARLKVIDEMLAAATSGGVSDLVAQAHLLRAAALLGMGDPAGREELMTYITLAGALGHARGRWGALTRRATLAQLAGRAAESAQLGEQALELGLAIGEPDALACFSTSRWSLVALGVAEPTTALDTADPLWPMLPLFKAWPPAVRGETAAAAAALGDFSVLDIAVSTGLEGLAAAAVVFAEVGTPAQRTWTYQMLLPHAGSHVVVAGCASYHAAVDHHLGALAAALGDRAAAEVHFRNAIAMHERLGAAGWVRLSQSALDALVVTPVLEATNRFTLTSGIWMINFEGRQAQLPDMKGLRDLRMLIGALGDDVHVFTLLGIDHVRSGADPVLDSKARAEFKTRLTALAEEIDEAESLGNPELAEKLQTERTALVHELAAATGLGGRSRRLGDQTERARKTVSARLRDALTKIDLVHPELAAHLHESLRMGTVCSYAPREPIHWALNPPTAGT